MTKFRPLSGAADSSETGRTAALPINVVVHNDPAAEYKYLLKSKDDPPQIRVVVSGTLDSFLSLFSNVMYMLMCQARSCRSMVHRLIRFAGLVLLVIFPKMTCKTDQMSVRPSVRAVSTFKRPRDHWADVDDTWHVGTQLPGSGIFNFGACAARGHPELSPVRRDDSPRAGAYSLSDPRAIS